MTFMSWGFIKKNWVCFLWIFVGAGIIITPINQELVKMGGAYMMVFGLVLLLIEGLIDVKQKPEDESDEPES